MKKLLKVLTSFALVFSLAACGSSASSSDADGASEKVLKIATDVAVPSIDQHVATDGLSFEIIGSFIEGLLKFDTDGTLAPALAESYDVSEDGLVYTFHLRDAEWADGTPVTAHDFEFSWKRFMDPEVASEYSWIMFVADVKNAAEIYDGEMDYSELGVKALDDKTFEVTLSSGAPYFLQLMAFPTFFPINEDFYNAQDGAYGETPENVLANGPFKVKEWNPGYGLTVEKNDSYYAADSVSIDGVEWRVFKDSQTAALEFESGNMDIVKLTAELVDNYSDDEAFEYEEAGYLWYVAPNYGDGGNPAIQNENFRKALAMSFDKSFIANDILNDGSKVANGIVPEKLATSTEGVDFREANGDVLVYDVAKAQEYWELAKAELGVDSVELELLFDDADSVKQMAEFVQSEWQSNLEGVTVTLKTQPKKQRLQLMRDGTYEVALTRWGPDYGDPQTYLELFTPSGSSNTSYPNTEYHDIISSIQAGGALASSDKVSERWDAMLEAEQILLGEAGVFPIFQRGYALLVNPSVSGVEVNVVGVPHVYANVKIAD